MGARTATESLAFGSEFFLRLRPEDVLMRDKERTDKKRERERESEWVRRGCRISPVEVLYLSEVCYFVFSMQTAVSLRRGCWNSSVEVVCLP